MKDSYSFDLDAAGLDRAFQRHFEAYRTHLPALRARHAGGRGVGRRDGRLRVDRVHGAVDARARTASRSARSCGYAANVEKATSALPRRRGRPGPRRRPSSSRRRACARSRTSRASRAARRPSARSRRSSTCSTAQLALRAAARRPRALASRSSLDAQRRARAAPRRRGRDPRGARRRAGQPRRGRRAGARRSSRTSRSRAAATW